MSVIGAEGVSPAVPLLQPLALSASTRRAVAQQEKLLANTTRRGRFRCGSTPERAGSDSPRVRARTLLMIALGAGVFYYILPQIAQVGDSWRAFQSAHWAWVPVIVVMSLLTYLAGGIGMSGHGSRTRAVRTSPRRAVRLVVRQSSVAGERRRDGSQRSLPPDVRHRAGSCHLCSGLEQRRRRDRSHRAHGDLLHLVGQRSRQGLFATVRQQDPAHPGDRGRHWWEG